MEQWERQEGEGEKVYQAFMEYLSCRSYEKVADRLKKSPAYIKKIAGVWKWRSRAAEYDKSLLEEARAQMKAEITQALMGQWRNALELQGLTMAAFREKDFSKASFKSLNEIYSASVALQMKLIDQFKLLEDTGENQMEIVIRSKHFSDEEEGAINDWLKEQGRPPIDFGE